MIPDSASNPADLADADPAGSGRAAPMSRADRRAAIVAATLPLLREHGHAVTTRQIAEASGIGEGTIFRVFADKAELIDACLAAAFDQSETLGRLDALDRAQPLPDLLQQVVEVLQQRLQSVFGLLIALRFPEPPKQARSPEQGPSSGQPGRPGLLPSPRAGHAEVLEKVAEVLGQYADRFRPSPAEVARVVRLFTFAASHPRITDDEPLDPATITDFLLYGVSADHPGSSARDGKV